MQAHLSGLWFQLTAFGRRRHVRRALALACALAPAVQAQTSQLLLDAAASDDVAIAGSGSGTILFSTAAPMAPVIFDPPASVTETAGGAASFSAGVRSSLPFAYQWSHDGTPLPDETHATLIRAPLAPADTGSYTVTVRNSAGAATSSPASLNVLPAAAPVVDLSFNADPTLDGSPTALLPLPDGCVLVANGRPNQLVKLHPDGRLDSTWAGNRFRGFDPYADQPSFNILALQPDGRILVGGNFATHNGAMRQNLLRLLSDGSRDDTFDPAAEAAHGAVYGLSVQPDGRILVAGEHVTPIRLLADGRLDAGFRMPPLPPATTSIPGVLRDYYARAVQSIANDKIVVASVASLQTAMHEWGRTASMVVRVHADGTRDESFSPIRWSGRVTAMRVLEDGGLLLLPQIAITTGFTQFQGRTWRFTNDGSAFPDYLQPEIPAYSTSFIYADGRVLYSAYGQISPIRLTALGAVDPTFTGGIGTATAIAAMADDHVLVAGSFEVYHGSRANRVARLNGRPNDALNPPRILSVTADKTTVAYGERVTIRAAVVGSGPLTYEWSGVAGAFPDGRRTTSPVLEFSFMSPSYNPGLRLIVRNSRGEATSAPLAFTVVPAAPVVLAQPTRISAQTGRHVTLRVEKNPTAGDTEVEWRRNGELLLRPGEPWADGQTLEFSHVTAADAGIYTLTLRNALGETVTSAPIVLTVDDSSRLANLSTRAFVGGGQQTLIAGFTVAGSHAAPPRHVLIRAVGPGLARFGVASFLPDPQLQVFDSSGRARVGAFADDWNDDWRDDFERVGAFPLESGSKDAATSVTVGAGSYTVHLTGKPGESGVALVEIYEDDNEADRMLNLSTRAFVAPGFPAIAGLGIRGPVPKKLLLRAVGPALASFGVGQPLSNPRLELKDERGATVATNDDWETNSNLAELRAAATAVGAFPVSAAGRDAALIVTLPPGNYTAVVEGGANESGVVLVDAYEVQSP